MKAIIFDLDGTVLDTVPDIALAVNKTLGSDLSLEQVSSFVGNGLKRTIIQAMEATGTSADIDDVYEKFVANYRATPVKYTKPFPGVVSFLKELNAKSIKIGIFSNKDQDLAEQVIHTCFADIDIPFIAGRGGKYKAKPDPQAIHEFCLFAGCSISDILYIGDSEVDFRSAADAGCDMRILTWGTRSKKQLLEAGVPLEKLISSLDDVDLN